MSAAEKVARLEAMLARVAKNRTDGPTRGAPLAAAPRAAAPLAAPPEPEVERSDEIVEETIVAGRDELMLDLSETVAEAPPSPGVPPSALVSAPRPAARPTPMERAISTELELAPPDADEDEPELEISYPEEEEPVVIEADEPSDLAQTAPLSTRSPEPVTERPPAPVAAAVEETVELAPEPIVLAVPQPSAPIARVASRPRAATFGELIQRALALRPR
ncbi:MAG: hypothetical protein KF729_20940 [Sandaracinaceae bacterium]|nr:hypothetical protein [Sandaracinaceae bacterium]